MCIPGHTQTCIVTGHLKWKVYLGHNHSVFGSCKKNLGCKNKISIWHPPNRDCPRNTIHSKKFPNGPLECIWETFCDARYQPNVFLHANFISCKKLCCSGMFSRRWKHYLGLKMPAKSKFYLDPQFRWDCVTVWQCMWLTCDLCDAQLMEFPHVHAYIVTGHLKRKAVFGLWKWCVRITQKISEVSKLYLYLAPPK